MPNDTIGTTDKDEQAEQEYQAERAELDEHYEVIDDSSDSETETELSEELSSADQALQSIKAVSFSESDADKAKEYIGQVIAICDRAGIDPVYSFDTDKDIPAGYGLSVILNTVKIPKVGVVTKGICISALPELTKIASTAGGAAWINKQILKILIKSIKTIITNNKDVIPSLPFSVSDFITSTRLSTLAGFNALASIYVDALKDKGLGSMKKTTLRKVLASSAFAEQQFPRVAQDSWVLILNTMSAHAQREGLEPGILNHWIGTRDEVEVDTTEIDLSDIESIVSSTGVNEDVVASA